MANWICHYCGAEHETPSNKVTVKCRTCGEEFVRHVTKHDMQCPDCKLLGDALRRVLDVMGEVVNDPTVIDSDEETAR